MLTLFIAIASVGLCHGRMEEKTKKVLIELHNKCRAADGQSKVKWDDSLADFAEEWARGLSGSCQMRHSTFEQRKAIPGWVGKYAGENLAYGMNPQWKNSDTTPMVKQGFKMWCDERKFYDYDSNSCQTGKACGHYTQIVWHNSDKIGCGLALCPNERFTTYMLACIYQAGGNYTGQKPFKKGGKPGKKIKKPRKVSRKAKKRSCKASKKTKRRGSTLYTTIVSCDKGCKTTTKTVKRCNRS